MSELPPIPDGFTIDQPPPAAAANGLPPIPSGFKLDQPASQPQTRFGWSDTWPVRLAESVWDAFTLPGDVYAGRVAPGSDEEIQRTLGLASLASPMSPAMRAGIGAFGVPISRSASASAPIASRAVGAANTAADLEAPLPAGLASDSRATQAVTQAARSLPFVGAKIDTQAAKTVGAAGDAVTGIADELSGGVLDRASAGATLRPSIEGVIEDNNARISSGYGALRGMLDQSQSFLLPKTEKVLAAILKERTAAGKVSPITGLEDVEKLTKTGATFDGLQRARSDLGNQIEFGQANPGFNKGDLKRLYGAMSVDMDAVVRRTVKRGINPDRASEALRNANATAAPLIEFNSQLQRLAGMKSEEGLVGALVNATQARSGNLQLLAKLRNAMPVEDFSQIAGVALSELGHNASTGEFSLNQFATRWDKMGSAAKGVLFSPEHRKFLDDIANLGRHLKGAERYVNRSQTALGTGLYAGLTTGAGALTDLAFGGHIMALVSALGTAGGGYALASWLARPATAARLARWARSANAYSERPGEGTKRAFLFTSRGLMNSLSPEAGQTLAPVPAQGSSS